MENDNNKFIEEEISFRQLAERLGIDDFDTPEIYDIRGEEYEVLSFDHEKNQEVWKPLNALVVKENAETHYQVNTLHGTGRHQIWVDGEYVNLEDYVGAEKVNKKMQVIDCEVADTHNYLAEGFINHNTTTPGGNAIPYASSVRIRVTSTGQQHILDKNGNPIGIKVKAKTIKNKLSRPFRECEFQIHFGKGITEHEEVFDLFRTHCSTLPKGQLGVKCGDEFVMIEGMGAWKTFAVYNATGEQLLEKKFYKADFNKVLYNPDYEKYMNALYTDALTVHSDAVDHPTIGDAETDEREAGFNEDEK
jgi:hypothetical protein